MRRFVKWFALAVVVLIPVATSAQSSATNHCTTTLSGSQSFATLTIPAGQSYCLDPDVSTTVSMGGNLIVEGTLEAKPSSSSVVHTIRFTAANEGQYVGGGMDPVATDDGLWVMGAGKLDLQGTPKVAWNRTGDDPSWSASDELVVAPTAAGAFSDFQPFAKGSPVPTAGPHSAEVLNLTRNVRIEGMPPAFPDPRSGENSDPGRAHVFVRSSVPQTIKHVAIRHMGPRKFYASCDPPGCSDFVAGRYGLHFHHNGDGSRGSLVEGVIVRDVGAHGFVPHASHGITFRDTIVYDGMNNGYWWDSSQGHVENPNESHDTLYDRAVAAKLHTCFRCAGPTGFRLEEGTGNTVRDSVAVGIGGRVNDAGYNWPESANQGNNVWTFTDNVAHNNAINGAWVWQNDFNNHVVSGLTAYRNGDAGIDHGAYGNNYGYENVTLFENRVRIQAGTQDTVTPLRFSDVTLDGNGAIPYALRLEEHRENRQPVKLERWTVSGYTVDAVEISENGGTMGGNYDFICWTLPGGAELEPTDFDLDFLRPDSRHRVQRRNGTAYQINPDGSTSSIAAFADCGEPPPPTTTTTTTTTEPPPTTPTTTTTPPPPSCEAEDSFTRTVVDGWGTADVGGAWTTSSADFDADGSVGTVATPTTSERLAHLGSTSALDVEVTFQVTVPGGSSDFGTSSGNGLFAYSVLRRQSGGAYARIGLYVSGDASNSVKVRGQDDSHNFLFTDVDTGLDHVAGDTYNLKVQAQGSGPTSYRAKVWKSADPEPGTWTVDTTSTLGPTTAGAVGVRVVRPVGNAQTVQFDAYKACVL